MSSYWAVIFIALMALPITMLLFGNTFRRFAPGYGYKFGYKTKRSMQSGESWSFAHLYFGKVWFIEGIILSALTVLCMLYLIGKDSELIGMLSIAMVTVELVLFVVSIVLTESALKKTFGG